MTVPILHIDATVRSESRTAGGPVSRNLGFEYVRELCSAFFGIPDVRLLQADGLDLPGADVAGLLARAKASWNS